MTTEARKDKNNDRKAPRFDEETEFKVADKRHWVDGADEDADEDTVVEPARPTLLDEYKRRAEDAEARLQEYIEAFKGFKQEQEDFRMRLNRDVERKVALQFGEIVREFLASVDDLDLALDHVQEVPEARSLADGVRLAQQRLLATLERHGVTKLVPDDAEFDPNVAEAVRVDPVDDPGRDGKVTETMQPGYTLGELVLRPARVAVGKYTAAGS